MSCSLSVGGSSPVAMARWHSMAPVAANAQQLPQPPCCGMIGLTLPSSSQSTDSGRLETSSMSKSGGFCGVMLVEGKKAGVGVG